MATIKIYIGAPIEHASERAALACAIEFLTAQGISAVIIANVNLKSRQIDLVIAIDQGVLVVEAKTFASMVRGGENGFWELRLASGRWKQIPNAYQQALDEKMAVRDAMVSAYQRAAIIRHQSRQHQERRTADFRRRKRP